MAREFLVLLAMSFAAPSLASAAKFSDRIVSSDGRRVIWTADWPTDTRVEFLGATTLSLEMRCDLLAPTFADCKRRRTPKRAQVTFCFQEDGSAEQCAVVDKDRRRMVVLFGAARAEVSFDPSAGGKLVLSDVAQDVELPLVRAWCSEAAADGVRVTSNQLFVLDFRKNFPTDVWKPAEAPELRRNSASTVKCLQTDLGIDAKLNRTDKASRQPAVPVAIEWFFCSAASEAACAAAKTPIKNAANFMTWPVQVAADGELFSPFVPAEAAAKLQGKQLMCELMGKPVAFYASPLNITNSDKNQKYPSMLRPMKTEPVFLYSCADYALTLPCRFKTPPAALSVVWRFQKNGVTTNLDAGSTNKDLGVTVSAQSDSITLRGPFSPRTEGLFSCTVTVEGNPVTGSYQMFVRGVPRPSPQMPKTHFLLGGGSGAVRCLFQASERIAPSLSVAGKLLNLSSQELLDKDKAEINAARKGKKNPINFSVAPLKPKVGAVLTYTETNASYNAALDSTHVITCIAEQRPFRNRARVVLRTLPRPKLLLTAPKTCKDVCDLAVKLDNPDAHDQQCVRVTFSWFLADKFPANGSLVSEDASWQFSVPSRGPKMIRVCAGILAGGLSERVCEEQKMQLDMSFFNIRNPGLRVLIFLLLLLFVGIVLAVVFYFKREYFRARGQALMRRARGEEAEAGDEPRGEALPEKKKSPEHGQKGDPTGKPPEDVPLLDVKA